MAQTPQEAARAVVDALTAAIAIPDLPLDNLEAAANNAHNAIEAAGGDYQAAFYPNGNPV